MIENLGQRLLHHRRFRKLLVGLVGLSIFLGIIIVPLEHNASGQWQIRTVGEGLWWAAVTVSGVGYGDKVPLTVPGRLVGVLLMLAGVVSFGLLVGLMSTAMTRRQEEVLWNRLFDRMSSLSDKVRELERKLDFLIQKDKRP